MTVRRFVSGQRIKKLPTTELNEAINAARDREFFGTRGGVASAGGQFVVDITNDTGDDVDQWAAVGFDDASIDPADNEQSFRGGIAFDGIVPTHADHLERFGVFLEPVNDGQVGRALLAGWLNLKVDVVNVEHRYVRPKDGTAALETCGAGGGRILWPRPFTATGEQWATVSFEPFAGVGFAYLTAFMGSASVAGNPTILTPATASADVWTFDSAGVWANTDDEITIYNPWESTTGAVNSLVTFQMNAGKWMLTGLSCDASQLTS
jgi:hypothetical protein